MSEHINEQYSDLENYFPVKVDEFERFIDPSISSLQAINQYYQFYDSGNISAANEILKNNPQLKRSIINADNLNKIRDAIVSIERYYLNDVQQYLVNIVSYRNDWVSNVKYKKYDVVMFPHNEVFQAFMCIYDGDVPIGTIPTNTKYFIPLTLQGAQGVSGIGLSYRGTWSSIVTYDADDCVEYNNVLWYAKAENINSVPQEISADWEAVLRMSKQITISSIQPGSQSLNDIWYEVIN